MSTTSLDGDLYSICLSLKGKPCRVPRRKVTPGKADITKESHCASLIVSPSHFKNFDFNVLNGRTAILTADELYKYFMSSGITTEINDKEPSKEHTGYICATLMSWALNQKYAIWRVERHTS